MAARDLISTEEDIHLVRHLYAGALDLEKLGRVECLFISLEELESYIRDDIRRLEKPATMMIHFLTGYISIDAPSQGDISVIQKGFRVGGETKVPK